jgi:NADP-dependent 3-hydroxy acid dehydrogenase YdfG
MKGTDVRGAVAVVTGASSGIGWATAWRFASAGATVVAAARRVERLDHLVEEISRRGGQATPVACDVRDRGAIEALRDLVEERFGRCDVLVNNAGVPGGGRFLNLSAETIDDVVRTNLMGVIWGTRAFLPGMVERGAGHVVNIASLAGRYAIPGSTVYCATKHGVVAFSEALYLELRPTGVLVTAINPGLVATERFPHTDAHERRFSVMQPERVADVVLDVVRRGRAPEVSVPKLLAAGQVARVLVPRLYRLGVERVTRGAMRPTPARPSAGP